VRAYIPLLMYIIRYYIVMIRFQVGVKLELLSVCSRTRFSLLNPINIIKTDFDELGSEILYLGEDEEESGRPKALGFPLIRCNSQAVWKFWSTDSSASTMGNWFLIFSGSILLLRR